MSDNNDFILRRQITPAAWQACLEEGRCFIVADASLNEAVPWLAGRYTGSEQHACLLWGETFRIHASAAPYCIPVSTGHKNSVQLTETAKNRLCVQYSSRTQYVLRKQYKWKIK